MFALQALNPEEAQETFSVEADSSEDSFCLSHPDLASIISSWTMSFISAVSLTGRSSQLQCHGTVVYPASLASRINMSSAIMNVLSSRKQLSSNHY